MGCLFLALRISYKRLWKLLIDRDMKRGGLAKLANVSNSTMTKLVKGESVNTDILVRICSALKCELWDIAELLPENDDTDGGSENG
jgi:DNA-binding Xre family transcriptional regulator